MATGFENLSFVWPNWIKPLGMISAFGIFNWECLLATAFLSILLLPLSTNKTIRYYGCYILYVVSVSTFGLLLLPIFVLRPRNVANLTLAAILLKYFTKLLGIEWELKNGHILKEAKGAVIVANHQSILDIMGMWNIWEIMGNCTAVAKKELLFVPPFGQLAWLGGLIFIDRKNPKKANEQIRSKYRLISENGLKRMFLDKGNFEPICHIRLYRGSSSYCTTTFTFYKDGITINDTSFVNNIQILDWGRQYLMHFNTQECIEMKFMILLTIELIVSKIWLFPEGTRNHNSDRLLPFKKGAFRTAIECKVPIIPVVFSPYYFIDGKKKTFGKGRIIISALEPIPIEGYTFDNMDSLIQLTYEKMNSEYCRLREECKIGLNANS